jgi:hypothetical protein
VLKAIKTFCQNLRNGHSFGAGLFVVG